jgi:hypothetical protein
VGSVAGGGAVLSLILGARAVAGVSLGANLSNMLADLHRDRADGAADDA